MAGGEYPGGAGWGSWRARTDEILEAFFPIATTMRMAVALPFFGACLAGIAVLVTTRNVEAADEQGWKILFDSLRDGKREIYIMDPDGAHASRLTRVENARSINVQPAWSPNRREIAFASNRDGNFEIYVMDADGSNVRRVTHTPGEGKGSWRPAWSRDGTLIAFQSNRDGAPGNDADSEYEIYVIQADGCRLQRVTRNEAADKHPAWSPDDKRLVFSSDRTGHWEVYLADADGANVRQLTHIERTTARPDWSPDGKRIAFMSNRDAEATDDENGFEIYVMDADGSDVRRLTYNDQRDARPRWSRDGKLLVFQSGTVGVRQAWSDVEIYTMNAEGSNVHRLTRNQHADMHPDW